MFPSRFHSASRRFTNAYEISSPKIRAQLPRALKEVINVFNMKANLISLEFSLNNSEKSQEMQID